jgi:leader peptidase (prepilin peptidase)/N-methyltransferase
MPWWMADGRREHGGMTSPSPLLVVPVVLAAAGLAAGAAARLLLRRLRRGARIPPPWCEVGVAVAWGATGALAAAGPLVPWVPVLLALGWFAVAAGAVDVRHRRLPDALTLPALPLALLLLAPLSATAVLRGVAGAAVAAAAYGAVHLVAPAALGGGDVKLAVPLGALLAAVSWPALLLAGVLAAVLTGALAVVLALARRGGRRTALPHGPSMLVAAWVVAVASAGCTARGP